MKSIVIKSILFSCTLFVSLTGNGQVGIGTTEPNDKAALDIQSSDKGILIPRLLDVNIQDINNPPSGLLVFNSDFAKFQYYDGFGWKDIKVESEFSDNFMIVNSEGDVSVTTEENLVEKKITMTSAFEQVMSIDTQVANINPPLTLNDNPFAPALARLDVDGRIKIGNDNISNPTEGMIRWSDETGDFEGYDGDSWKSLTGKSGLPQFGTSAIKIFPDVTDLFSLGTNAKYYGAMIEQYGENIGLSYYDTNFTSTIIVLNRPNFTQAISINSNQTTPSYNLFRQGEDWIAYRDGNDIRTWKFTGTSYVEQDPIEYFNSFDSFDFVSDDVLVTYLNDAFTSFLTLYQFNDNSNNWEVLDDPVIPISGYTMQASGDTILLTSDNGNLVSYKVTDNNEIEELSSATIGGTILSSVVYKDVVFTADDQNSSVNNIRLTLKNSGQLSPTYDVEFLKFPYLDETPEIILEYFDDILAVGIPNAFNDQGIQCGRVLLYENNNSNLEYIGELFPSLSQEGMEFGKTISIDDEKIQVSAPLIDVGTMEDNGAIYTFERKN